MAETSIEWAARVRAWLARGLASARAWLANVRAWLVASCEPDGESAEDWLWRQW